MCETTLVTPLGVRQRAGRLTLVGVVATLVAMVATTLAAALAVASGVDFEMPEGGESIPIPGFATVTGIFSLAGVVIALGLLRWSSRPEARWICTSVTLTAASLVAPLVSGASGAAIASLVALHIVAAAVMIPALARGLRARRPGRARSLATSPARTARAPQRAVPPVR